MENQENSFLCSETADADGNKMADFAPTLSIEVGHDQCLFWILTVCSNKQYGNFVNDREKVKIENESFLIISVNQFSKWDPRVGGVQVQCQKRGYQAHPRRVELLGQSHCPCQSENQSSPNTYSKKRLKEPLLNLVLRGVAWTERKIWLKSFNVGIKFSGRSGDAFPFSITVQIDLNFNSLFVNKAKILGNFPYKCRPGKIESGSLKVSFWHCGSGKKVSKSSS